MSSHSGPIDEPSGCSVVVVDDEESMRRYVERTLKRAGCTVRACSRAAEALALLDEAEPEVLVTDIRMPGMDGLALFARVARDHPSTRTVLISAHGSVRDALKAMADGAEAYLPKPFEAEELVQVVAKAGEKARLLRENEQLKRDLREGAGFQGMAGSSKAMRALFSLIRKVAPQPGVVLITGESGTGKEMVARAIHRLSAVRKGPFVPVACASLPPGLLEAELFGVQAGAFTGATRDRPGYVERALSGTLFLDEIGDIPPAGQTALLRLLESGDLARVGSSESRRADVRILAATHRDLKAMVSTGEFREDLYYRLHVLPVRVPPLRERREDIPRLIGRFLDEVGRPELVFSPEALEALKQREYRGNVRELRNLAERLAGTVEASVVEIQDLAATDDEAAPPPEPAAGIQPYREALREFERSYVEDLLRQTRGNISEAARASGLSRPGLHARLGHLRLDASRFRQT